ncbi:GH23761 [Drosophila grimshawi]|uniref:GH23761 n=1 Tax=Drosophila grimshawi TaxID=7222 RepID=B4JZY9_DROGR|nr:GH23761 [Drosophila grimshawi]
MDKCSVLNGAVIARVAATPTGTVAGAITTPAPTTTTVVKGDASMTSLLSLPKKSSARNSINEDGHTQSHDVSIIEDDLSVLDSEITNVEEGEDNRLSTDELQKKNPTRLYAPCSTDRFCRRYWKLLKADGIFIEALKSAHNDI